jgi:hypothetical protein
LFVASSTLLGCAHDDPKQSQRVDQENSRNLVAKAGFGLPNCHVGMPIKKLRGQWKEPDDPDPELAAKLKKNVSVQSQRRIGNTA